MCPGRPTLPHNRSLRSSRLPLPILQRHHLALRRSLSEPRRVLLVELAYHAFVDDGEHGAYGSEG